jgi:hypothetical protein
LNEKQSHGGFELPFAIVWILNITLKGFVPAMEALNGRA